MQRRYNPKLKTKLKHSITIRIIAVVEHSFTIWLGKFGPTWVIILSQFLYYHN